MKTDFFELKQRGTNVRTEMIAGITTFFSMSYILAPERQMVLYERGGPGGPLHLSRNGPPGRYPVQRPRDPSL